MKIKPKLSERIFDLINVVVMLVVAAVTLVPFLNVIAKAFSSGGAVSSGRVSIIPIGFQLDTMKFVLQEPQFKSSMVISLTVTLIGTIGAMILTILTAYPLSKLHFRGRKVFLYIFIFTMLFQGGIVPNFLLYKSLGLTNTINALIFSGMFSVYNMLIMKTFFEGLPETIEEAAKIDGASNLKILFKIVLPISKPVLATIGLFYAVNYWNNYFNAVLYITKPELKPLQQYLYELVTSATNILDSAGGVKDIEVASNLSGETIRSATILASTLPILCLYPWLQKYFQKGMTIGSVKG
jgi:putative aldouronate transport system permease protein